MEKIKTLLSKLNWWQKLIVIAALAAITYFSSGCSLKARYHADNITYDIDSKIYRK